MGTTEEERFGSTEASPWMRPFVTPRFLRSGHLQTIVGNVLPRNYSLPEPESQLIEVEPSTSSGASFVLCHYHWQPVEVRSQRRFGKWQRGHNHLFSNGDFIGEESLASVGGLRMAMPLPLPPVRRSR
jgi:hypothetical protein